LNDRFTIPAEGNALRKQGCCCGRISGAADGGSRPGLIKANQGRSSQIKPLFRKRQKTGEELREAPRMDTSERTWMEGWPIDPKGVSRLVKASQGMKKICGAWGKIVAKAFFISFSPVRFRERRRPLTRGRRAAPLAAGMAALRCGSARGAFAKRNGRRLPRASLQRVHCERILIILSSEPHFGGI
jgi:hypothetical protein